VDFAALAAGAVDLAGGPLADGVHGLGDVWREINRYLVGLAASPWALAACFALAVIDGFFPPVPAETLIVATAAVCAVDGGWGDGLVLWGVAACGALTGDCVAFTLGRVFNASNWRIFRKGKGRAAMDFARRVFARSAAPLLMVARFIPVGRVAVNLTAGTVGYPFRRFVMIDSAAALCWGAYCVGIGFAAGHATQDNPLLAVLVGIVLSASVGTLVQWLMNRRYGKGLPTQPAQEP
jgi:membrane protein DedA with SNARE-associated domain